jgi:hypothetical protein
MKLPLLILSALFISGCGCDRRVDYQIKALHGLEKGYEYKVNKPVFIKVYKDVISVEIPNVSIAPDSIEEYQNTPENWPYIVRIIDNFSFRVTKAVRIKYSTHHTTVIYGNIKYKNKDINDVNLGRLIDKKSEYIINLKK